jgi:hypothetical protein
MKRTSIVPIANDTTHKSRSRRLTTNNSEGTTSTHVRQYRGHRTDTAACRRTSSTRRDTADRAGTTQRERERERTTVNQIGSMSLCTRTLFDIDRTTIGVCETRACSRTRHPSLFSLTSNNCRASNPRRLPDDDTRNS